VEEVEILRRWVEGERVDCDIALPQSQFDVAAVEERRDFSVAVSQIEDDRQRLVLLSVGDEEIQQKAFAAAGRTEHQRMTDVIDMQIEEVRRLVARLEDGQGFAPEMRTRA